MGRENKKEEVAALHRKRIMEESEKLFSEKGYDKTTIDDISKAAGYSRRTIYAYYESKDDILHHIVEKGLINLKNDIENAVNSNEDFIKAYKAICMSMVKYQNEYHLSADNVVRANTANFDFDNISDTLNHILSLGTDINAILEAFIENGKEKGLVREDVIPMLSVYVLSSSISSVVSLGKTKGQFISNQFSVSESEFLDYGFKQLINSILKVSI